MLFCITKKVHGWTLRLSPKIQCSPRLHIFFFRTLFFIIISFLFINIFFLLCAQNCERQEGRRERFFSLFYSVPRESWQGSSSERRDVKRNEMKEKKKGREKKIFLMNNIYYLMSSVTTHDSVALTKKKLYASACRASRISDCFYTSFPLFLLLRYKMNVDFSPCWFFLWCTFSIDKPSMYAWIYISPAFYAHNICI